MPAATRCIRACYLDTINASLPRDQTPIIELYSVRRTWCTATRCISACNLNTIGASLPRDQTPLAGVHFIVCSLYSIKCDKNMWISYMQCYAVLSDASLPPPHISTPSVHHHHCLAASPLHDQTLHKYAIIFLFLVSCIGASPALVTSTGADAPKLDGVNIFWQWQKVTWKIWELERRNSYPQPHPPYSLCPMCRATTRCLVYAIMTPSVHQ